MTQILTLTSELQTPLNLGDYTISATQSITVDGASHSFSTVRNFRVAGPRFVLESDQVLSMFPPPNTNGDYNNFLPNLTIRRATLPWERQIVSGNDKPFLALLMVSEAELVADVLVKTLRVEDFGKERPGLSLKGSDDLKAEMRVVEADGVLLKSLLPSLSDLAVLAHVRKRGDEPQEAIIIGNRRPLPNTRYAVHLVSLEGLNPDTLTAGKVKVPSLYSWEFMCGADKISLVERLKELHCDGLRLPDRAAPSQAFQGLRQDGYAVMPYSLAWGDRTHGLYRGPFVPVSIAENSTAIAANHASITIAAGLESSEGLVDYFPNIGLTDISLAAAWELGRMLMLRRRDVAIDYYRFRRQQAGLAYREANAAEEQHLVLNDIPQGQTDVLPDTVRAFCEELITLQGIPFPYLVPDQRMLLPTSLRVFRIDRRWLCCLLGGALSLGPSRAGDRNREADYLARVMSGIGERSGVLMRSPVVPERPNQTYVFEAANGSVLPILRRERLASDVLLIVVGGVLNKIKASEEPQAAHFGFEEAGGSGPETFEKDLRNPNTFNELVPAELVNANAKTTIVLRDSHYRSGGRNVLQMAALATEFAAQSALIKAQSHHFALQLIESGAGALSIPLGG